MSKSSNQKTKLLHLARMLLRQTDEDHPLTVPQIIEGLARQDIKAERKSIYDDLEALRLFGLDIQSRKGKVPGWFVGEREFELPEVKLLMDAVQSSRFITQKKSDALIRKLEGLASSHQAGQLQRQVFVSGRIKVMNASTTLWTSCTPPSPRRRPSPSSISTTIYSGERCFARRGSGMWSPPTG